MENIYEWMYDHYYRPLRRELVLSNDACGPDYLEARRCLLIQGGGDADDRTDALDLLRCCWDTLAFAAGVQMGVSLMPGLQVKE